MTHGIPPDIESRIRARGPVIDLESVRALYADLLNRQVQGNVKISRGVAYGPDVRHRLDVYHPASAGSPPPVMLFFHGGGFVRGDKAEKSNVGIYFANRGFLTLCANYRLAPQYRWPAGAEDVVRAFSWASEHAANLGGDPRRLFLAGESAGAAHVAAATLVGSLGWRIPRPPAGAILISGVYNVRLEALARSQFGIVTPDLRNESYFGIESERYAGMSTVDLVDAAPFPLLITYAELDPPQMQVQAGELFARLVTQHRFAPRLSVIRGHNHLSQVYAMNTGDELLGEPMTAFINSVVG